MSKEQKQQRDETASQGASSSAAATPSVDDLPSDVAQQGAAAAVPLNDLPEPLPASQEENTMDTENQSARNSDRSEDDNDNNDDQNNTDNDNADKCEQEIAPSSSLDPQELEEATAAVVSAASRQEHSDSILSVDSFAEEEYDDDDDDDETTPPPLVSSGVHSMSERYMEQASVEFQLMPSSSRKNSLMTSRSSFRSSEAEFEESQFQAVEEESVEESTKGTDDDGEASEGAAAETKTTTNQLSSHVGSQADAATRPKSLGGLLESCGALPLSVTQLREIPPEDLPAALLQMRKDGAMPALKKKKQKLKLPFQGKAKQKDDVSEEVLLLYSLFAPLCSPSPSLESLERILAMESRSNLDLEDCCIPSQPQECISLPMDILISTSGAAKASVVALLSSHPDTLLELPPAFSLGFVRILIRLLTNETDQEYDVECLRACPWLGDSKEEVICKAKADSEKNIETTTLQEQRVQQQRKAISEARRQRQAHYRSNHVARNNDKQYTLIYTLTRFFSGTAWTESPTSILLKLFESLCKSTKGDLLLAPVARLLGLACAVKIEVWVLRRMLKLASDPFPQWKEDPVASRDPAFDRLLLVRALCVAARGASPADEPMGKTGPRCFYSFGRGKGMFRKIGPLPAWPFRNDFGMALWFRAESFDHVRWDHCPKLLSIRTFDGGGVEVLLMPLVGRAKGEAAATVLAVSIFDADGRLEDDGKRRRHSHLIKLNGCLLLPKVWYHVGIRHTRSRLQGVFSLSAREQISIMLDGKLMLTEHLPFPKIFSYDSVSGSSAGPSLMSGLRRQSDKKGQTTLNVQFGANFEGQTGSLYLFHDNVSDATLKALYEITAGPVARTDEKEDTTWDSQRADKALKSSALAVEVTGADAEDIVLSSQDSHLSSSSRRSSALGIGPSVASVIDLGEEDNHESSSSVPHELSKSSLASKLFMVLDPARTVDRMALELHAGAHVGMDADCVVSWLVVDAKDAIASIGGVQALVPIYKVLLSGDVERCWSMRLKHFGAARLSGDKARTAILIPSLVNSMSCFVRGNDVNARELLRCGAVDIFEQLLLKNKSVGKANGTVESETLMGLLRTRVGLAEFLVDAVLNLRSACSHYTGLETTVYSRVLFNLPLWFGDTSRSPGVALHVVLLPVLSWIARSSPGKARDCVGMKPLIEILKDLTNLGDSEEVKALTSNEPATQLFDRSAASGMDNEAPLTIQERRHISDILLGIMTLMLTSGATSQHFAPLLNYLSFILESEWEQASADVQNGRDYRDREGSRLERHVCSEKLASLVYLLLQTRPVIPGLFDSFETCCGGIHEAASWILCSLVNSFDDSVRSIGVRCLSAFLDVVGPTSDAVLVTGSNFHDSSEDLKVSNSLNTPRLETAKKLSATISNVGKGLVAIGNSAGLTKISRSSRVSVTVVYKLLWHLLKAHRSRIGPRTHDSLVQLLLDNRGLFHSADALVEIIVAEDDVLYTGYRFANKGSLSMFLDQNAVAGKKLRDSGAINIVLRLLRFLNHEMKEKWLFDLVGLFSSTGSNLNILFKSPQWQPSLFHLASDILEEVRVTPTRKETSSSDELRENVESGKNGACCDMRRIQKAAMDAESNRQGGEEKDVPRSTSTPDARMQLNLSLKLYSSLLGFCFRRGGDQVLHALEQAASLQRACVNGEEVFSLVLNHFLADLIAHGTIDMPATEAVASKEGKENKSQLKESARIMTEAIISNGSGDTDVACAVNQWRCLRHLSAIVASLVTKRGFGVVDLFDYKNQQSLAVDSVSGGLHGIRLPDGDIEGMDADEYMRILGLNPNKAVTEIGRHGGDFEKRINVMVASQVLSLLDAFIFPETLEASHPISQLHGLALVRSNEPRLGASQGPVLASLIRLSLVLMRHLEPSSVKFLQCCSRLRCFLYWAIELIRESTSLAGYSAAFQDLTAPLDRLILAIVLHAHRGLSRCSAVLLELEGSDFSKYFSSEEMQTKNQRRLLRVAFELREIVLAAYRGRNEVLNMGLSPIAFAALKSGLESANKSGSKETVIREFLKSQWILCFHDVNLDQEFPIPEQTADGQINDENHSEDHGRRAIEQLAKESHSISRDFDRALDECFETYLQDQRQWAETDAVRDLEFEGDTVVKRLSERHKSDEIETRRLISIRAVASGARWKSIERKVCEVWNNSLHWKLAKHTDRLNRRILLVRNRHFSRHDDASYDLMLAQEREKASKDREERERKKMQEELAAVMRRNTQAFTPQDSTVVNEDVTDEGGLEEEPSLEVETEIHDAADTTSEDKELFVDSGLEVEEVMDKEELVNDDAWAKTFIWSDVESVVARFERVSIVSLETITEGKLLLTTHGLYFHQTGNVVSVMTKDPIAGGPNDEQKKSFRWRLSRLSEVHGRRFLLRSQALELFFSDSHELFINFAKGTRERDRFYAKLRNSCKVPLLWSPKSLNPRVVFRQSQLTSLWKVGKISNFQYLMELNKMAGRTFNDITQYPVFPWVLADYTSKSLDLHDSRVYRDLSKPVGALNPDRLAQLLERYKDLQSFGFADNESFLYGSHYSSPGAVLHFMLRQEPFTSMAIELQSGRFDCPDRLFFDIAACWKSCLTSSSDVKELIPEFYTCPEMFLNTNKLPLGRKQDGRIIDNVTLPPWAEGSAYEFVRKHRLALESDYVSRHLHHWIDLIFGYKQRGPEAEAAHNVFHYLSYEGSVDLDKISDEIDRTAAESHIQNFGQTPSQLLSSEAHPPKNPVDTLWRPLINDVAAAAKLRCSTPGKQFGGRGLARGAALSIHVMTDALLVVYADLTIGSYKWNPQRIRAVGGISSFSIRMDKRRPLPCKELSTSRSAIKRGSAAPPSMDDPRNQNAVGNWSFGFTLGGNVEENLRRRTLIPPNRLTAASKDMLSTAEPSTLLISCGFFDDAVKVHSMDGSKLLCSANGGHRGRIRCVAVEGGFLVTGGEDATCRIWVVDHADMAAALADGYVQTSLGGSHDRGQMLSCCHVLFGHQSPVSCLALCSDLDITVSGSLDGTICVHTIRRGKFVRSFKAPHQKRFSIRKLAIDTDGIIVAHTEDERLHTFTVNAVHCCSIDTGECLNDIKICGNNMVVTGGESGKVVIRTLSDLRVISMLLDLQNHGPIRCISLTPKALNPLPQYLFIGSDDGMVTVVYKDPPVSRKVDEGTAETETLDSSE